MQAMEHSFPLEDIEAILFEFIERSKRHDTEWLKEQFRTFVEGYREGDDVRIEVEKLTSSLMDEVG